MDDIKVLYSRELPGGGMVLIEAVPTADGPHRARLCVERRSDVRRRSGHAPPVIAEFEASTRAQVFQRLYELASDNVALARALIQRLGPAESGRAMPGELR
ncbi:MAG TPA: hypothetical protein VFK13_05640 [Gemmatimonadaceae bacterium]|nr:hypothetical protein [Gemmatimonadaceae bacterium]